MRCKEVMSEYVECVAAKDAVSEAAAKMKKIDAGFLPVFDPDKRRVVGTITDRDIAIRVVAEKMPLDTPVSNIMTKDPVCCSVDDDVSLAHQMMAEHQVSRMIVVEDGDVAGVISMADLTASTPEQTGETLSEVKRP